jgi:hypothetical protein
MLKSDPRNGVSTQATRAQAGYMSSCHEFVWLSPLRPNLLTVDASSQLARVDYSTLRCARTQ